MEMATPRGHADHHAAPAHEGIDRLSRTRSRTARSSTIRTIRASASGGAWGSDRSEQRLCEYRCLPLLDDMSNWVADKPGPPKYILSISRGAPSGARRRHLRERAGQLREARRAAVAAGCQPGHPGADARRLLRHVGRGADPVVCGPRDRATSGRSWRTSSGRSRSTSSRSSGATAEDRSPDHLPTTDLPPMGSHHFEIPFDATGKKWVRFAAWDSAGNGALVQPVKLSP